MKATGIVRRIEECVIIGQKLSKPAYILRFPRFLNKRNSHKNIRYIAKSGEKITPLFYNHLEKCQSNF